MDETLNYNIVMPVKARIDSARVEQAAELLAAQAELPTLDYTGMVFPSEGDPRAPDYFFAVTLHQYGFWLDDGKKYLEPMYAVLEGRKLKGSDYLFRAFLRAGDREPEFFQGGFLAEVSDAKLGELLSDDSGTCPLPDPASHGDLARAYGRALLKRRLSPASILAGSRSSGRPLKTFLNLVCSLPGYREDPLRKKALLLALILSGRPEKFLAVSDPGHWAPVVDYHNLRCALRLGLVEVSDADLHARLAAREFVSAGEEAELRELVFRALRELIRISGRNAAQVDALFFNARRSCPEMTPPDCGACVFASVCPRRTELFQPVFRTTCY